MTLDFRNWKGEVGSSLVCTVNEFRKAVTDPGPGGADMNNVERHWQIQ